MLVEAMEKFALTSDAGTRKSPHFAPFSPSAPPPNEIQANSDRWSLTLQIHSLHPTYTYTIVSCIAFCSFFQERRGTRDREGETSVYLSA